MNALRSCLLPLLLVLLVPACGPGLPREPGAQGNDTDSPPPAQDQRPVVEGVYPTVFPLSPFHTGTRTISAYVRGADGDLSLTLGDVSLQRVWNSEEGVVVGVIPESLLAKAGTLQLRVVGAQNDGPWPVEVSDGLVLDELETPYRTLDGSRSFYVTGAGFDAETVLYLDGRPMPTEVFLGWSENGSYRYPSLTTTIPVEDWRPRTVEVVAVSGARTSNKLTLRLGGQQPVPVLTAVSPGRLSVGGLERTLTLQGSAFTSGMTVRINGVQRTWEGSQSEARVTLAPEDWSTPQVLRVTAHAPDGTSSLPLLVNVGTEREVPVVDALEPAAALVGSSGVVLRVKGTGFHGMSQVTWNGQALPTRVVLDAAGGAPVLEVTLSSAQLAAQGVADVAVFTAGPGGGSSEPLPFIVRPASAGEQVRLSHAAVERGHGELELTVHGSNFDADSRVRVQDVDLVPTLVAADALTVRVPGSAFTAAGRVEVRVARPGASPSEPSLLLVRAQRRPPQVQLLDPGVFSLGDSTSADYRGLLVRGTGLVKHAYVFYETVPAVLQVGAANLSLRFYSELFGDRLGAVLPSTSVLSQSAELPVRVSRTSEGGGTSLPLLLHVTAQKPTAHVWRLSSSGVRVGASSAFLRVYASGLHGTSVVRLDDEALPTRRAGANTLVATVPAALLTRARVAEVTVTTDGPPGTSSRPLPLRIE